MDRPVMGRRDRVRVELGLSPSVAEALYTYAKAEGLTLSQTGDRALTAGLDRITDSAKRSRDSSSASSR